MPALLPQWSGVPAVVIGMIHLPALPGAPRCSGSLSEITEFALRDADALAAGRAHALMLENFYDVPFFPGRVPAHAVASMTAVALEVRRRFRLPLGVNVLRNDGRSALAVALASGAEFIRVNVLCGARVTDQGLVRGIAHELLRDRRELGAERIRILADVDVKHSAPLAARPLAEEAEETLHRGLADGLIVSGAATGKAAEVEAARAVRAAVPEAPLFIGSGVTAETVREYLPHADGFIVGTALKRDGVAANPVDAARVRELVGRVVGG